MEHASPRPRQVTLAGWLIIVASVGLVVTVWQQIATLHTIDTRAAVERVIDEPPFDALGLAVDDVLGWIRVLSMISGACATATAILGWQALQRSRTARVALSVLAVPLFFSGFGSGVVLSTAVAVAVLWLWLQPARDWFDGVWRPEPPAEERRPASRPSDTQAHTPTSTPASTPVTGPTPSSGPPPYPGWASAPGSHLPPPPPYVAAPPHVAPPHATTPPPYAGMRRPPAVLGAAVLTWFFSVVAVGLFIFGVTLLLDDPQRILDEMNNRDPELVERSGITVDLVRAMVIVMGAGVALWGLGACALAVLVVRRHNWARILLMVSAAGAGVLMLLGAFAGAALVLPAFACGATVGLLLRRDVAQWFTSRPPTGP